MMHTSFRALLVVLVSLPVYANPFVSRDLVIPVIGRIAGAFGSDWRTDVVVSNLDEDGEPAPLSLIFSTAHGVDFALLEIQPGQTMVFDDIVKTRFHVDEALGWLRISTVHIGTKLTAYARIYNTNATRGESSQLAPAIPVATLGRDVFLSGLTGLDPHRTNVGFGSTDGPLDVTLTLRAPDGSEVAQRTASVGEDGLTQINDVFSWFGVAPLERASVRLTSATHFFAYASTVRNDTGDGYLLTGAARDRPTNDIVTPACSDPAPLNLAIHPAQGYLVGFDEGTNPAARTEELEQKYGFEAELIFQVVPGFYVRSISVETVAALRCESDVTRVDQNGFVELAAH